MWQSLMGSEAVLLV